MSAKRKQAFNARSMAPESRNSAYAAINILWGKMRPDLKGEGAETNREERLAWMAQFLGWRRELKSTKDLSDQEIGVVLEEMRRMTGEAHQPKQKSKSITFGVVESAPSGGAEIIHSTSAEQLYALEKLANYLEWDAERIENYLQPRFKRRNFRTLKFDQATALTIQMFNIAAHRDLKAKAKDGAKISRTQTAKYIPSLKKKLGIDQ
jgi:hypothetical protein